MYWGTGTVTTMYSVRWERANADVGTLTLEPGEACAGTGPSQPGCSKGTAGAPSCSYSFEIFSPTPLHFGRVVDWACFCAAVALLPCAGAAGPVAGCR